MVESAVRHFLLQFFVGKFERLDVLGAVEMRFAGFYDPVNEYHVKYAAVPVRIHGELAEVADCFAFVILA